MNASYISAIERNVKSNPSTKILEKIASTLKIDVIELHKQSYESLFDIFREKNNIFLKDKLFDFNLNELNVLVYLDYISQEEDTEIPCLATGVKFLDEADRVLFSMIVDKLGDGGISSYVANERRRSTLQIALSFAEYYLQNYLKLTNMEFIINKRVKSIFPIFGLKGIENYEVDMPYDKEPITNYIHRDISKLNAIAKELETHKDNCQAKIKLINSYTNLEKRIKVLESWWNDFDDINFL